MTPYGTLLFCPRPIEGFRWLPYLWTTIYTRLGAQTFPRPSYRLSSRLMQAPSLLTSLRPWQADDTRCRLLLFPRISSRSPEMCTLPVIPQKLASTSSVRGQCPASTGLVQESCMSRNPVLIDRRSHYLIKVLRAYRRLCICTKRRVAEKCLSGRSSALPGNRCRSWDRPGRNTR